MGHIIASGLASVLFFKHSFILHRLENRTKPISTPYDGRHWWDSNLRRLHPHVSRQLWVSIILALGHTVKSRLSYMKIVGKCVTFEWVIE